MLLLLNLSSQAKAETLNITETLQKLPALKQGISWSFIDNKLNYLSTIEIASWKGITFEAGYAGSAQNTGSKAVAVISYPIIKLKDLGVTLPILDLIEANLGVYGGFGRIDLDDGQGKGNNEWDTGVSLTLLNIKF